MKCVSYPFIFSQFPEELITGVATFNHVCDQYTNPLVWPRLHPRDCVLQGCSEGINVMKLLSCPGPWWYNQPLHTCGEAGSRRLSRRRAKRRRKVDLRVSRSFSESAWLQVAHLIHGKRSEQFIHRVGVVYGALITGISCLIRGRVPHQLRHSGFALELLASQSNISEGFALFVDAFTSDWTDLFHHNKQHFHYLSPSHHFLLNKEKKLTAWLMSCSVSVFPTLQLLPECSLTSNVLLRGWVVKLLQTNISTWV